MKYTVPILLLVLAAVAPIPAHAESWANYKVDKCRLKYPISLFDPGGIDAENFQRFSGPNKDTYFRTIGLPNEEQLTPGEIRAEYIKEKGTTDLVYERTKRIFWSYRAIVARTSLYEDSSSPDNQTICVLHISYPREAKRSFDSIVTRMSRSFTAEN